MTVCVCVCVYWNPQKLQKIDGEVAFLKEYCASFESFTTGTGYISELFRYLVIRAYFTRELAQQSLRARTFPLTDRSCCLV